MYIKDIIRRSGRSLRSAKGRTLLTASAIAVGTFALTMTLAASNGAQKFVDQIINANFDPSELTVAADKSVFGNSDPKEPQEYDPSFGRGISSAGATIQAKYVTDEDITRIKQVANVEEVREGIILNLQYVTRPGQKKMVGTIQAVNPSQKPDLAAGAIQKPIGNRSVYLPEAYIAPLGFKDASDAIGKTVTLSIRRSLNAETITNSEILLQNFSEANLAQVEEMNSIKEDFTVAAVYKKPKTAQPGTEFYMFIGNDDARRLNDYATEGTAEYRKYLAVSVKVKNGNDPVTLKKAQTDIKNLGYESLSVEETQAFLNQIIAILQGIVATFGAIAVIASVFGIINTMYISVLQRTREIGLMKALGMRRRDIGRLFRYEAAWIGFLGGILGSLLAIGLGKLLNPWITKKLDLGAGNDLLIYKPSQVAILIGILILISTLAGWLPSRKAAKLDPIEALRTE